MYRRSADEDDRDLGPLTTAATYLDPVQAELGRAKLESCGVRAVVVEPTGFNPLLTASAGGVLLKVAQADVGRAQAILDLVAGDEGEDDEPEGTVRCPRCELAYCFFERPTMRSAGASGVGFFAWVTGQLAAKRWHCRKCEHVWTDASEGPTQRTPVDPDDPRPVFRLRRAHAGMGVFLGAIAGAAVALVGGGGVFGLALLLGPAVGWFFGAMRTDYLCSEPSCRAALTRDAEECPRCKGAVAGGISRAAEHYAEVAEFRRELAGLRAAGEAPPPRGRRLPRAGADRRAKTTARRKVKTPPVKAS